ncbi:MAG: hypothetical protein U1E67_22875 [Hyphomicrobiales bacterium]
MAPKAFMRATWSGALTAKMHKDGAVVVTRIAPQIGFQRIEHPSSPASLLTWMWIW